MATKEKSVSIWQESMRVGLPKFDEERKDLAMIIELLHVNPLQSVASEFFLIKFGILQAAAIAFFKHEELLLSEYQLPDKIRQLHRDDHERILMLLSGVHGDSIKNKNQTAIEVYESVRAEIEQHILHFGTEMRQYLPPPKDGNG